LYRNVNQQSKSIKSNQIKFEQSIFLLDKSDFCNVFIFNASRFGEAHSFEKNLKLWPDY
jgi:CRISPR/Cas system CMR-associated protein Cmr1 (group 7 of RAMP superfamily)